MLNAIETEEGRNFKDPRSDKKFLLFKPFALSVTKH